MKRTNRLVTAARRFAGDRSAWSALAVAAAGLLLVEVNVLAARTYQRWDFSRGEQFSPSAAGRALVRQLSSPIEVIVLLPLGHPLRADVRHMLEAFQSLGARLSVRFVDPERDTAEYLALAKEREQAAKNPSEPQGLPEAALLVRNDERSWFVPASELYAVDAEGQRRSRIEPALGEAILRVQTSERLTVCFVTGHGERSIDDGADDGLLDLRQTLEVKNLEARRTPLDVPRPDLALRGCSVIALIGPKGPVPPAHEQALLAAAEQGASFFLLLDPIVDARGGLAASGLEHLSERFGIALERGFVLERKPEQRLPQGIGEAFLAEVAPHPITSGLTSSELRLDRRVVLVAARPLELTGGSTAVPLLTASPEAVILDRLGSETEPPGAGEKHSPVVAAAARSPSSGEEVRAVIVGASNPAESRSYRDASLSGNRVFVEQALGWVAARPLLAAIPEKEPLPAGLALTEDSLADVLRYVLLYMPGAALFIGIWVLWRRRQAEARFRAELAPEEPQ